MRPIPDIAKDFVSEHEELRLKAYPDPASPRGIEEAKPLKKRRPDWKTLSGDPWSIGYGHTGPEVHEGLVITKAQAEAWRDDDLREAAGALSKRIGDVINDLTSNQYSALLSFVFNLGTGKPKKPEWTIWKVLRARQFDQVPVQMMRFVYSGGNKVQGLVNRRAAEVVLWSTEEPGSVAETLPSSVTRTVETPPAPMAKPLAQSKSFVTTAVAAAASAPVAVKQVNDAIAPYAGQSETVAKVVAALALIAAVLAVVALVLQWMKHRSAQR